MTLHLLPNLLSPDADPKMSFVEGLPGIVNSLDGFFVENPKEARQYLSHFDFDKLRHKPMEIVDKRTVNFEALLAPLARGENWGVVVDAGLPCIADPGSQLVWTARQRGIEIFAYPGPSSIILALMLSGLDSNHFIFQGYLPRQIDQGIRKMRITQVFIETPYNNQRSLEKLLAVLIDEDILGVACDLTLPSQEVIVQPVSQWQKHFSKYNFQKRPAIFLLKTS